MPSRPCTEPLIVLQMAISKRTKNSEFFDSINADASDIEFQQVYRHYLISYVQLFVKLTQSFASGSSSREIQLKSTLLQLCYRAHLWILCECEDGLGSRNSVCLSIRPSVCLSHAWTVASTVHVISVAE